MLVRCGCLNLAKRSVTPDLEATYAQRSLATLQELGLATESFDAAALRRRFPYVDADLGHLDVDAGVVDLPAVRRALTAALEARGVQILERLEPTAIARDGRTLRVATAAGAFAARALVVTAGHGTNDVLARLDGCTLQVPIAKDRPSDAQYLAPPAHLRARFTAGAMPVIAYLDAGIYCHPIVDGLVDEVKIGYYNPPDLPRGTTPIDGIARFVDECLPGLRDAADAPRRRRGPVRLRPRGRRRLRARACPGRGGGLRGRGLARHRLQVRALGRPGARRPGARRAPARRPRPLRAGPLRPRGGGPMSRPSARTLEQRLAEGVVIGAEGYVFELERRGYVKAGPYVPEVSSTSPRRSGSSIASCSAPGRT